jgi:DNA-binding HxlR family transcriptional regulator
MRSYGQACPVARASEILAERWTPIILNNMLHGATTFSQIAEHAPGIPRSLLTSRLNALNRAGVIEKTPNPEGRGHLYRLSDAGKDLADVMQAMGEWAERWLVLGAVHINPDRIDAGAILDSWCRHNLAYERLPEGRVVARFDLPDQPTIACRLWFVFEGELSEICHTDPGYDEDLVVTAESLALAEWHFGRIEWTDALRDERIRVSGPTHLRHALPSWNRRTVVEVDGPSVLSR